MAVVREDYPLRGFVRAVKRCFFEQERLFSVGLPSGQ
jgi:hypothetical protein